MKILLINPPIREWSRPNVFPSGLGYIAAVLRNQGHEVDVMDINALRLTPQEVEEMVAEAQFDVVGTGAIVTVYKYVKWLATILKRYHPNKKIIVGGSVSTSIPQTLLERTDADIACIGEGEVTVCELVSVIEHDGDLSKVAGIWFKDQEGEIHRTPSREPIANLDTLPLPAWDLFPMDIYLKNPVGAINNNKWIDGSTYSGSSPLSMNMNGTRGCPYPCNYCYHDFLGAGYRTRSPENIIHEMKILKERYGVRYIHFIDDEFALLKKFVYEFCDRLKAARLDMQWGCTGRVNVVTEELVTRMKESGCIQLALGIESGSDRMLKAMRKQQTAEQARKAIGIIQSHIGFSDCTFMIGAPGENIETVEETIQFCKDLDLVPEAVFFTTPYPGTELYGLAKTLGKIGDEEAYVLGLAEQGEKLQVNFTEFDDETLYRIQEYVIDELKAWNKVRHPLNA